MTDTFDAYRTAHHAHAKATARAQAASARYTAYRTRDAREAMGDAWRACDRAMHVMFDARDAMCGAVVGADEEWLLLGGSMEKGKQKDSEMTTPSQAAVELGGRFRRPHSDHTDAGDREMIQEYLAGVPCDGDPRSIAERLDALVEVEAQRDEVIAALVRSNHTPWCATNCQHAIHDCDCGWQEAVNPYLPTADDVRGILTERWESKCVCGHAKGVHRTNGECGYVYPPIAEDLAARACSCARFSLEPGPS